MRFGDLKFVDRARRAEPASHLDVVQFDLEVQAPVSQIAGPYWFGRAFEDPPIFNYSLVADTYTDRFTCGIAEWLTDARGYYIGAMVWFSSLLGAEPQDVFDGCLPALFGSFEVEEQGGWSWDHVAENGRSQAGEARTGQWSWFSFPNWQLQFFDDEGSFIEFHDIVSNAQVPIDDWGEFGGVFVAPENAASFSFGVVIAEISLVMASWLDSPSSVALPEGFAAPTRGWPVDPGDSVDVSIWCLRSSEGSGPYSSDDLMICVTPP